MRRARIPWITGVLLFTAACGEQRRPADGDTVTVPTRTPYPERGQGSGSAEDAGPAPYVDVWVTDSEGRPIADAEVSHPRSSAATDAHGHARLGPPGFDMGWIAGDRWLKTLTVKAPGHPPLVLEGELRTLLDGRRREIRVRLPPLPR